MKEDGVLVRPPPTCESPCFPGKGDEVAPTEAHHVILSRRSGVGRDLPPAISKACTLYASQRLLTLTVDQALSALAHLKKVGQLQILHDLSLALTSLWARPRQLLSGGEAQRLKLASEMRRSQGRHPLHLRRAHHRAASAGRGNAHRRAAEASSSTAPPSWSSSTTWT